MLVADAMMNATQPGLEVGKDEMDHRQIFLGRLEIAPLDDSEVFIAAPAEADVATPVPATIPAVFLGPASATDTGPRSRNAAVRDWPRRPLLQSLSPVGVPQLGRHEDLGAREPALASRSADILFIAVDPRGVDVPVPNVQGMPNGIPGLRPFGRAEDAKTDARDEDSIVELNACCRGCCHNWSSRDQSATGSNTSHPP